MPLWVQMNTEVVEGDTTGEAAPILVYGSAGEEIPETTDTGIAEPVAASGARGLFLENSSSQSVCYVHIHECAVATDIKNACGQVEAGKSAIVPEADLLGARILERDQNAVIWLEADCVTVFAVDCDQARCWFSDDVDLTLGDHTMLLKG
ncbi:MAG: hypothetical protein CL927_18085 [Deltaproteobacteria bacterium]|nr:hypothetical protein [Deltaproteobacteria bacterium]HCH66202.1 hypothetical protein [Deltaproteobacteria bacterium]